jgi:hypothetical protein
MCDNRVMTVGWLTGMASGVGILLTLSCATQQQTAQALTIAGAAAVLVGASMAADEQCQAASPGEAGYCPPGFSEGTRNVGKGLAVAGVGAAAAGYALTPKGPDRRQGVSAAAVAPGSPYRLVRAAPAEPTVPAPSGVVPEAPAGAAGACAVSNASTSGAESGGAVSGCSVPPAAPVPAEAAPPEASNPSQASRPPGSPPVQD